MMYTNVSLGKDHILYLGRDSLGRRVAERIAFEPKVYLPTKLPTKYRTVRGKNVEEFSPGSINECRQFVRQQQAQKQEIYGNVNYQIQYIGERHPGVMEYDFSKVSVVNIDIETESEKGWSSVDDPTERVNVVTMKKDDKFYTLCLGKVTIDRPNVEIFEFTNERELLKAFIELWKYLEPDIVTGWNNLAFDIPYMINRIAKVLGNGEEKKLSPWKRIRGIEVEFSGRKSAGYEIGGVAIMDYMRMYRAFTAGNRESWGLDYISKYEFDDKVGKIPWQKLHPTMKDFYTKDFNAFVEYNIQDVELVSMIENKRKLIQMAIGMCYYAKINYEDVFNQTRIWDALIYHHLNEQNVVVPMKERGIVKGEKYKGAAVKDAIVNLHEWVVSVDATSLYPMSIVQWNISPDTIMDMKDLPLEVRERLSKVTVEGLISGEYDTSWLKKYNLSLTPNGQVFDNNKQGFMGVLILDLFSKRKAAKKLMLDAERRIEEIQTKLATSSSEEATKLKEELIVQKDIQIRNSVVEQAAKVTLNSCYGAMGNEYFRFYDLRTAEGVTYCGQYVIKSIIKGINLKLNAVLAEVSDKDPDYDFVIASDTDSAYIRLNKLVTAMYPSGLTPEIKLELVMALCDDIISPHLVEISKEFAAHTNAYKQSIMFKRESICNRMIVIRKKGYILNILVGEAGKLAKPKIKLVGLEAVKSSTPSVVRKALKDSIQIMIQGTNDELISYIEKFKDEFYKMPADMVAFPRGVSKIYKWTGPDGQPIKSTPIHTRGSIHYNIWLKKTGTENKYNRIIEGDKIKYLYLTAPNRIWSNIVAFPRTLPTEFELDSNIDYATQFEKSYIKPLKDILTVINWTDTKTETFDDSDW